MVRKKMMVELRIKQGSKKNRGGLKRKKSRDRWRRRNRVRIKRRMRVRIKRRRKPR